MTLLLLTVPYCSVLFLQKTAIIEQISLKVSQRISIKCNHIYINSVDTYNKHQYVAFNNGLTKHSLKNNEWEGKYSYAIKSWQSTGMNSLPSFNFLWKSGE